VTTLHPEIIVGSLRKIWGDDVSRTETQDIVFYRGSPNWGTGVEMHWPALSRLTARRYPIIPLQGALRIGQPTRLVEVV
jgi:hypothetical protein